MLILGGAATVAILGIIIVRLSGAATWRLVAYNGDNVTLTTTRLSLGILANQPSKVVVWAGGRYRTCILAHNTGGTSKMTMTDVNGYKHLKTITTKQKYCTPETGAHVDTNATVVMQKLSGSNIIIDSSSIERLY